MDAGCCFFFLIVFFFFCCCYEKLRNRGAVLRGDEVEKELRNGGSKWGDVSEETSLYFQSVRLLKHDIYFISLVQYS